MNVNRTDKCGMIDRNRRLWFRFNGRDYMGYAGDTLASALLANGVRLAGRSFKLHRPRGLMAAGVEEVNVLVSVGTGGATTTNLRATEVDLVEGLDARTVNVWPSLRFDIGAINDLLARFFKAGFYYKTFMWPDWHLYEPLIRHAAGLGRPAIEPDPARYEHQTHHCDVLVIGAGQAGVEAASQAAQSGARVILVEQEPSIQPLPQARVLFMSRTTAIAYYDHNLVLLIERPADGLARERFHQVRADRIILATGTFERPLLFPGNDRPGIMLASAAKTYAERFGALAGRQIVLATNNTSSDEVAFLMAQIGAQIVATIDWRCGERILKTMGRHSVKAVLYRDARGKSQKIACDAVLMSGGWNPNVQLFSQAGGKLTYDPLIASFRPAADLPSVSCVGAANGDFAPDYGITADWTLPEDEGKIFVDFQNDATVADIRQAADENFRSVEHLKRYTTLGMAVDQGKTANVNALAIMGSLTGQSPGEVGTTRFRPPYTPTSLGAFGGLYTGLLFKPYKQTPLHVANMEAGAVFEDFGGWLRPAVYLRGGESHHNAMRREALAVRNTIGLFDGSPLGKIAVVGPDAALFLDHIYANPMSNLATGKARYGLMLNELGVVIDDGVTVRVADDHFLVGTTSSGADRIALMMEEWLQCEWTTWRVLISPVTTLWGNVTLSGPKARDVLVSLGSDIDLDQEAFPHMSWRQGKIAGMDARVARVSFTGELTFEISVASDQTEMLWDLSSAAAKPFSGAPIGINAWNLLRLEKSFLHIGADTDGTTLPADIGWTKVANRDVDFVGRRSLLWTCNQSPDRLQLVGLAAHDPLKVPPIGMAVKSMDPHRRTDGFVTSSEMSPSLNRPVTLAMVRAGRARIGETITLMNGQTCQIVSGAAYDPEGARLYV